MKQVLLSSLYALIFIVGLTLVVISQRTIGYLSLAMMITGLAMLLFLMYTYNKKYNV